MDAATARDDEATLSREPVLAQLRALLLAFAGGDGARTTDVPRLSFTRRSEAEPLPAPLTRPSLVLVIDGVVRVSSGVDVVDAGPGDALVVSAGASARTLEASVADPHLAIVLELQPNRIRELVARARLRKRAGVEPHDIALHRAAPSLLEAALRLARLVAHPDEVAALAPLCEEEVLYRLLQGPAGSRLLELAAANGQGRRIARAVAYLKDHFTEPLRIEHLAAHVGMSASSFHEHFKAVTSMTPLQYQKQLRLHEARRALIVDGHDVASAGFLVGYQSASQFTREYARLYGCSPGRDASRVRKPSGGGRSRP